MQQLPIPSTSTSTGEPPKLSSRDRLLASASEIFALRGLVGATTREIAERAGVNEVTLFRHFINKQNLLAAVIERVFAADPVEVSPAACSATGKDCLFRLVSEYAAFYFARLSKDTRLIRVLMGEIQHCDQHATEIVKGVFRPQWEEFIERLSQARELGFMRPEVNPVIIADLLGGMILANILRSGVPVERSYSTEEYLAAAVEMIVSTIAQPSAAREPRRAR